METFARWVSNPNSLPRALFATPPGLFLALVHEIDHQKSRMPTRLNSLPRADGAIITVTMCTAQESQRLFKSQVSASVSFYTCLTTEGFQGSKKSAAKRQIHSPEVGRAWPPHISAPCTRSGMDLDPEWSRRERQRLIAQAGRQLGSGKPARLLTGHFCKCQSKKSNECKRRQKCKQKRTFFLLLSFGTANKGDRRLFQPLFSLQVCFFCAFLSSLMGKSRHGYFFSPRPKHFSLICFMYPIVLTPDVKGQSG